jgi:hypothetical protein
MIIHLTIGLFSFYEAVIEVLFPNAGLPVRANLFGKQLSIVERSKHSPPLCAIELARFTILTTA